MLVIHGITSPPNDCVATGYATHVPPTHTVNHSCVNSRCVWCCSRRPRAGGDRYESADDYYPSDSGLDRRSMAAIGLGLPTKEELLAKHGPYMSLGATSSRLPTREALLLKHGAGRSARAAADPYARPSMEYYRAKAVATR